jgi:hypothetical protein
VSDLGLFSKTGLAIEEAEKKKSQGKENTTKQNKSLDSAAKPLIPRETTPQLR